MLRKDLYEWHGLKNLFPKSLYNEATQNEPIELVRTRLRTAGPSELDPKHHKPDDYEESWELQGERLYRFLEILTDKKSS